MKFRVIISLLLVFFLAQTCYGDVFFSSLPRTLVVSASPLQGQVLKAGEDRITGKWGLNESLKASVVSLEYKNVKVSLCYAPVSQIDRGWRATVDNLNRDKTCQFTIANGNYDASQTSQSFDWPIEKDIPSATYFVRVYAYNSTGEEVGFGQTTDASKISNLFEIQGISGNHVSFDIASICFSAFSLVSLFGFLLMEKRKNKRLSEN
ncbi:high-affinity nitrate transporter 3.2-like [Humulus lupulus]|uniref:high-affinity nitrate transporter 3.2-like n=1 Tax=Humulus lupulus TaxID=3486 RepID=UPI002B412EE4|nr:high-affinity nitrate transporter 3.2-like [Humulus lupulus]